MRLTIAPRLLAAAALLFNHSSSADDVDVYHLSHESGASPLRVMFALDLRREGVKEVCSDASSLSCRTLLGRELHDALDLFGFSQNSDDSLSIIHSGDGKPDIAQPLLTEPDQTLASKYWLETKVDNYEVLRAAFRVVIENASVRLRAQPRQRRIEVGLIVPHADSCSGSGPMFVPHYEEDGPVGCSQGAYVLKGFTDISSVSGLNGWLKALAALPDPGRVAPWMIEPWEGHPYKIRDIYLELHRYLNGQPVYNGFLGIHDYGSQLGGNLYHSSRGQIVNDVLLASFDDTSLRPLLSPDLNALQSSSLDLRTDSVHEARYRKPLKVTESCPQIMLVHILSGGSDSSNGETDNAIAKPPSQFGLSLYLPRGEAGDLALVEFLSDRDRLSSVAGLEQSPPIESYFFEIEPSRYGDQLAKAAGTEHRVLLHSPRYLVSTLEAVLSAPLGESRAMVAASTVVNDAGRPQISGDLFFPLFRPDSAARWVGNVKKLKFTRFGEGSDSIEMVVQAPLTSQPKPALSDVDGLIRHDALTFWTDPTGFDVLAFDADLGEVSGTDGRSVTRGGAGQRVRGYLSDRPGLSNDEPGARQLFTLDPAKPGELLALDANLATLAPLATLLDPSKAMDEQALLRILRWIRGEDVFDSDGDGETSDTRAWLLGDVLHSRPLAVSYGAPRGSGYSQENPDIRLFYGSNDGFFRVIRNTWPDGSESGEESWAFLPPGLLSIQHQLANNLSDTSRPYGMDGEPVALVNDADGDGSIDPKDGDSVWVFVGQRRGGKRLFAFDVSNPDKPKFMWELSNRSSGFDQLALTFSTPRIAHLDLGNATPEPVLVFAGGYHGGWNGATRVGKDVSSAPDTIGNAIYVVKPETSELLWRAFGPGSEGTTLPLSNSSYVAELLHSIPSPLSIIDSNNNGIDDRAYVGDSGGNIWRIDFSDRGDLATNVAGDITGHWQVSKLAALGGSGVSDRRFFHAPDVTLTKDEAGDFVGIAILSGNRAAPLELNSVNYAYFIKDRRQGETAVNALITHTQLQNVTQFCGDTNDAECLGSELSSGWKMELTSLGEKGLSAPVIADGKLFFTSYVPAQQNQIKQCEPSVGSTRLYAIELLDASPAQTPMGRLRLASDEQAVRHRELGPGLLGDVVPFGPGILIPGVVSKTSSLFPLEGASIQRTYWREHGVDEL
ncbi:MAG: PilC/PilY family type IV pilus protein [Pseudomonadota bacterium]